MKRRTHPVDDFFREALREHQIKPSDAGRQQFLREVSTTKIGSRSRRTRWLLAFAGLVVVSTASLLLWMTLAKEDQITTAESGVGSGRPAVGSGQPAVGSGQGAAVKLVVPTRSIPVSDTDQTAKTDLLSGIELTSGVEPTPEPDSSSFPSSEMPLIDTIHLPEITSGEESLKQIKKTSDWQFAVSVYYAPEWMFNTLEGDKYANNFGLEGSFTYGRYSLRTGIGLSLTKGTNELMVEYNDYLGTYNQLDSIQFHWDEMNYHLLPTYYLSMKDVWDSLMQLDYPCVIKRYTYLQIPLILGYDVLQNKWMSLGFRAGPILSILIQSKQLSEAYDPGKNRIIRINQVTPDRIQTNWQVQGGLNASFRLARRIRLELEPTIKYYFNSVYEKSDVTKKPWSAGFRTSITIQF